ncbi:phasin family protein [Dankookia sp. GCM10030260]|uniref:phasin family protein n=1 Tax=Dankookia sp. GCM10030260 TaxID=3273390 RepID=UPI0036124098
MASVTEAKVAATSAPRARPKAKAVEAMAAVATTAPPAPEPDIGIGTAPAPDMQATVSGPAAEAAVAHILPPAGTTTEADPAQPMRMTLETTMDQATKATEGFMKAAEQATEFTRGNFEAMTKATQLYLAGMQDLGKQTMAMVQGLADHGVAGAKALGTVKSLKEAAEIQATFTRAAVEKSMAEGAKLQEAALKLAETSFAPLSARMTLAVEKFGKPLAA